jgi:hypothetical protein
MKPPCSTNYFWIRFGDTAASMTTTRNVRLGLVAALVVAPLTLAMVGCRKPINARTSGSPADSGMMGQVYTNGFFGLSLAVPAGWSVAPPFDHSAKGASADARQLLLISEKPLNSKADSNPTLLVVAEKISVSGARTGKEYVEYVTRLMAGAIVKQNDSLVPYSKAGDIREFSVSGRLLYRADLTARVGNRLVRQSYFSTVINDHAVSLVIAGLSDADIKRLEATVAAAVFAQR